MNVEQAGESLLSLRLIVFGMYARKVKQLPISRKFGICLLLTGPNIDLVSQNALPTATTRRDQSAGFSARFYVAHFQNTRWQVCIPPPLPGRVLKRPFPGEG